MTIAASLVLSVPEVILLLFGAVILGITIHFFITSRRSLKATTQEMGKGSLAKNEWKLRYLNDIELRDKEISSLKLQLSEAEENANIYSIEADEMRKQNFKLDTEIKNLHKQQVIAPVQSIIHSTLDNSDYLEQLKQAQSGLIEQNQKINLLLGNIDVIKEHEEKHREIMKDNADLSHQLNHMRIELGEKEKEISSIKQKEQLTKEMTSMLDSAYSEFNVLQSKIQKLEVQLNSSRMVNMEYENLKEEHSKLTRDYEEQRTKLAATGTENQQLQVQLMENEDKLREANFQRQQLQKRVAYLEELNTDLQVVSDANKKLETQLRRIGELESMLNVVAEERDNLMRRQGDDT
jgi:chromosome segregation ATPase